MMTIIIRSTKKRDLPSLLRLEQTRWKREPGTPVMELDTLEAWLASASPYFLVAEKDGSVVGYYYGVLTDFAPQTYSQFLDTLEPGSYWSVTHTPTATSMYGISMASVHATAGAALLQQVTTLLREGNIEYYAAISRLNWLRRYIDVTLGGLGDYAEDTIATWYAVRSAVMLAAPTWDNGLVAPQLHLPDPKRPDGVLGFHIRHSNMGLLHMVPNFMPDANSLNYGVLIASAWPHQKE